MTKKNEEKRVVYKMKTSVKVFIVLVIAAAIGAFFGIKKYNEYLYTLTDEYALLQLGYTMDDINIFNKKLSDNEIKEIIKKGYDEFIPNFVDKQYFLYKNLDLYLSHVTTKEEDFFAADDPTRIDYDDIIAMVNIHGYDHPYESSYKTDFDKGYALLSNKHYELGNEYEPDDLVDIEWKYRLGGQNDKKQIRKEVYEAYLEMWEAAKGNGIYLLADSAYRSYKKQNEVYKYYEDLKGTNYADGIAARPGFSEHQTGLTLDIYSKECTSGSTFKDSKTFKWLIENSYKYGFILRYPEGKEKYTGYNYESWHYRYLGKELAEKVYKEGITFDEYYAFYIEK